jgi:hypothetical protein
MNSKKQAILISKDGILYRGFDTSAPTEVWDYPRKKWVTYHGGTKPVGWGKEIDESAAEKLKSNNADAEPYLYYDTPPWAQPLSESYSERVVPGRVRPSIVEGGEGGGE